MGILIFLMYAIVIIGDVLLIGVCGPFWVIYMLYIGFTEGDIGMIIWAILIGMVSIPFVWFAGALAYDIFNFVF